MAPLAQHRPLTTDGFHIVARATLPFASIFTSFVGTASAVPAILAPRQEVPAAQLQISDITAPASPTSTQTATATFISSTIASCQSVVLVIWSTCRAHHINIAVWSICVASLVVSCVLEQEYNPMRLWLAICLVVSWLIPTSLQLHKLVRRFQSLGRAESFIVATAMLSFALIKAFAVSSGYNVVALIRVLPCLTMAIWITSHWCNFDETPDIGINA